MTDGASVSSGQVTRPGMSRLWIITDEVKMMDETLSPIHPGEVLLEDFMKPLGLSQYRLAQDIGVTPIRISQIVNGQRAITVDTAMRLARYFGTSAVVWLRLQVRYDLEVAEKTMADRINREVKVLSETMGES
jgi:addiction module HigA family antidote